MKLTRQQASTRFLAAAATLAMAPVLVLSLTSCSKSASDAPSTTTTPSNAPTAPANQESETQRSHSDGESASDDPAKVELALEAATVMTTWTPATDFNRTDAEMRARQLMTEQRAKEVIAPERPATGEEWLNAEAKNATSQPKVSIQRDHHEHDSVAVEATWQWVTDTGETWAGNDTYLFFFTFTTEKPYKIRDYVSFVQ